MNGRLLLILKWIMRCYSIRGAGFEGPIPTPSFGNHSSAINHHQDVKAYITTELAKGAMLGPFPLPAFIPWCQTNPLLMRSKRNSTDRLVIMDLSWPLLPLTSTNSGTHRESFLGIYKNMHLPSAHDLCDLICTAGKGCYLYSLDMARAYMQLSLKHGDWPFVCFNFQRAYYTDINLRFGILWAAAHCQDVTSLITREFNRKGEAVLSYIDDFEGITSSLGSSVLPCGCVSPSSSSLCSGSSTRIGTLAGMDIFMTPPGLQILVRWTKTHQSVSRAPVLPIPEVPGHPMDLVAAYCLLVSPPTSSVDQPLLTYLHRGCCTMVTVPILS